MQCQILGFFTSITTVEKKEKKTIYLFILNSHCQYLLQQQVLAISISGALKGVCISRSCKKSKHKLIAESQIRTR